jgi:hypothetical protein
MRSKAPAAKGPALSRMKALEVAKSSAVVKDGSVTVSQSLCVFVGDALRHLW